MINTLFHDMLDTCLRPLDDFLVCRNDVENHLANLETILLKLRDAGLKAKLAKCEFLKSKMCFLCHKIGGDGIHTMEDKITAIKNFPTAQVCQKQTFFP